MQPLKSYFQTLFNEENKLNTEVLCFPTLKEWIDGQLFFCETPVIDRQLRVTISV